MYLMSLFFSGDLTMDARDKFYVSGEVMRRVFVLDS